MRKFFKETVAVNELEDEEEKKELREATISESCLGLNNGISYSFTDLLTACIASGIGGSL